MHGRSHVLQVRGRLLRQALIGSPNVCIMDLAAVLEVALFSL